MSKKIRELSIVIPAYNESEGLAEVVLSLKQELEANDRIYEIIVVDDGSSDNTAELARANGAKVLSNPVNAGYGYSLMKGFSEARFDYVAMIDADGTYPAAELIKLLDTTEGFDMVVGARFGANYWGSMYKYPIRLAFLWMAEYVTGTKIPDANSGLRIIRKSALRGTPLLCTGFSFSTTLTMTFISSGLFVKFVPVTYLKRKGVSKIRLFRDTLRAGQVLFESLVFYNPLKLMAPFALAEMLLALAFLIFYFFNYELFFLAMSVIAFFFTLTTLMLGALINIIRLKSIK